MKRYAKQIILATFVCTVFSSQSAFAQQNVKEIFAQIPDSIFYDDNRMFEQRFDKKARELISQEKFYREDMGAYQANAYEIETNEKMTSTEDVYFDIYRVKFDDNASIIETLYFYDAGSSKMIIYVEFSNEVEGDYTLTIIEKLYPEVGVAAEMEFHVWQYNQSENLFHRLDKNFVQIDWEDCYSADDYSELNMHYLSQLNSIPLDFEVITFEKTSFL